MDSKLIAGARYRLVRDVMRYPNFIAEAGLTGVLWEDQGGFYLQMDELLDGAQDWDNGIQWFPADGDDPAADLAMIPAN